MKTPIIIAIMTMVFLPLFTTPIFAHEADRLEMLFGEIENLKRQQDSLRKEIQEMKSLLKQKATSPSNFPENLSLESSGQPFVGNPEAKVALIEFTDYQCPFCRRHIVQTFPAIDREYIATGKLKYIIRDFPLETIHPDSFQAALAANCAGEQGHYWEMHDRLFAVNNPWNANWMNHAEQLGLALEQFQACMTMPAQAEEIRRDLKAGFEASVRGTPTFFLGYTDPQATTVKVLRVLRGAQPFHNFKEAIDALLANQPQP